MTCAGWRFDVHDEHGQPVAERVHAAEGEVEGEVEGERANATATANAMDVDVAVDGLEAAVCEELRT